MEDNNTNSFEMRSLNSKADKLELLKKDLEVNLEEKVIINKKLEILKGLMHETPNTDPSYALMQTQVNMNQIELDEIINRSEEIKNQIRIIENQK